MKKEDEKEQPDSDEKKPEVETPLSRTIKNAHASGDGSIKRNDESINNPEEDSSTEKRSENTY